MNKKQIQAIKDAIYLVKQSEMACSFSSHKKPTKRMVIMKELLKLIRDSHMNGGLDINGKGTCILDANSNCFVCDIE